MELSGDEIAKLQSAADTLYAAADRLNPVTNASTKSESSVHINAGGMGLWIASTCCIIMFIMFVSFFVGAFFYVSDERAEIREMHSKMTTMQSFLDAIYVQAPQLKPKDKSYEPAASDNRHQPHPA
jgi:hypothetical protein